MTKEPYNPTDASNIMLDTELESLLWLAEYRRRGGHIDSRSFISLHFDDISRAEFNWAPSYDRLEPHIMAIIEKSGGF